ncbi:16S rRNA (adenine(1518)-N(6)/adenine(1519)-N(6))-dimethyltransferase RsmA [Fulvivirgaceae bacterium BMA10]|uniref:Ribosomal RNA small subunit methyltransferase A n=1 Tax=Splendidivirga corallicola TaxID=3051826 RepID=A0ABT8KQB7_9BACT|nr:16S rRNA (adenine(1518)-N(6)/adenine(1519)-N(6))-dimethyltransferase RsmA [Fulvivirgaceae bacterium BMA10]
MTKVRPKKYLGQHFLRDLRIAEKIAQSLTGHLDYQNILEVGPGMGVLTDFLMKEHPLINIYAVDVDKESIAFLNDRYGDRKGLEVIHGDFLRMNISDTIKDKVAIIGNFPYNISSQIFFKTLELKDQVPEVVCMLQKEVAERIVAKPGGKIYGILSVLLQAFYEVEYLFTVEPHVFHPPPKVKSAVIRLIRNSTSQLKCDEQLFKKVVKSGFQNRRKTLRNALKKINLPAEMEGLDVLGKRAEQLSVNDFIDLTFKLQSSWM